MRPRPASKTPSLLAACLLTTASCGGSESTSPKGPPPPPLAIVAGANVTDTMQAQPAQALVVEVHDSTGAAVTGATVRFEAQLGKDTLGYPYQAIAVSAPSSANYAQVSTDVTNASGRAQALLQFGVRAGPAKVVVRVPERGLIDTASFTIVPGNAARFVMRVRDTAIYVGAQYSIVATATDRGGNLRPTDAISYAATTGNVTVSTAGALTATAEGRGAVLVSDGSAHDTARVSVVPHGTIAFLHGAPNGVAIINLDGTGFRILKPTLDASVYPQWAPDGKSIIIYEGNPDGTARLTLVALDSTWKTIAQLPEGSLVGLAWPRFAPNGTILFGGSTSGVGHQVWSVHSDGTAATAIPNALGNGNFQRPAVSPDGGTLIYDNAQSTGGVMALNLSTGATTPITADGTFPVYSPDGTKIAYIGSAGVMVADASGANAKVIWTSRLVNDYSAPSWSADSRYVLVPSYGTLNLIRLGDGAVLPLPHMPWAQPALH